MSLTDEEIQELCLDCGLGVVIGDHFKNLARAIERIAHERGRQQGLMEAQDLCDAQAGGGPDNGCCYSDWGDAADACKRAIKEHAAKGGGEMSRTQKTSKPAGFEYWGRRPGGSTLSPRGGKHTKKRTHKAERQAAKGPK